MGSTFSIYLGIEKETYEEVRQYDNSLIEGCVLTINEKCSKEEIEAQIKNLCSSEYNVVAVESKIRANIFLAAGYAAGYRFYKEDIYYCRSDIESQVSLPNILMLKYLYV
jgi:hypothetical protein